MFSRYCHLAYPDIPTICIVIDNIWTNFSVARDSTPQNIDGRTVLRFNHQYPSLKLIPLAFTLSIAVNFVIRRCLES